MRLRSLDKNLSYCGLQCSTSSQVVLLVLLPMNHMDRTPMFLPVLPMTANRSNSSEVMSLSAVVP